MMEFTLSRVILCVAGVMLLGALLIPVVDMFEERDDVSYQGQADNIASMIDTFYTSDVDEMTIYLDKILPQGCEIGFKDHVLTLYHNEKMFESLIDARADTDSESYGRGQTITLTKHDGDIVVKKVI